MARLSLLTYPPPSEGQVGVYRHSVLTLNPCQSKLDFSCSRFLAEELDPERGKAYLGLRTEATADWAEGPGAANPPCASPQREPCSSGDQWAA